LPVAEQHNLMSDIDLWVMKKTCEYIQEATSQRDCFSINLSGATLGFHHQARTLVDAIRNSGIKPELLIFEITETSAISDLNNAVRFMHEIKNLGCRFALDDFGSGLSSFTYLKQMPVDFLKIDGDFIRNLQPDTLDFSFVQSFHAIAKSMGIYTIAEWVEDKTVMDYLKVMGIDYVQGYYTGPPAPLS
jgi:Amt family ammonium transporter